MTSKRNHVTCKNSHQTTVNTMVTSQTQILIQRNYVMERSVQNFHEKYTSVETHDFIMQPYETIPRIKLRKTTHRSRTFYSRQSFYNKNILNSYIIALSPLLRILSNGKYHTHTKKRYHLFT